MNEEGIITPAIYMKQAVGRVDGNFKNHPQQNWTVSKVKRILDNEMYLGNMVQGKLKSPVLVQNGRFMSRKRNGFGFQVHMKL